MITNAMDKKDFQNYYEKLSASRALLVHASNPGNSEGKSRWFSGLRPAQAKFRHPISKGK
jgi:hypothetical protein